MKQYTKHMIMIWACSLWAVVLAIAAYYKLIDFILASILIIFMAFINFGVNIPYYYMTKRRNI